MKAATTAEIDALTREGRSLYYPGAELEGIEREVLRDGTYVSSGKPATVVKIKIFDRVIGSSEGEPTTCAQVECTSGSYHGRPITPALYAEKLRRMAPCCNEDTLSAATT